MERRTLDRWLSRLGVASREVASGWILTGRVRVDGRVTVDPATVVDERSRIELDGAPVSKRARIVVALHKPKGYVTTSDDPNGRRTVYDLLTDLGEWVGPIGRLDRDSSGLLLLTNDTDLAERVTAPKSHVAKRYLIDVRPRIDDAQLAGLARGPVLDDGPTAPSEVQLVAHRGPTSRVELTLTEGRNRQVRRMARAVGVKVTKLVRTAIGPVELAGLASGTWRLLTPAEIDALG